VRSKTLGARLLAVAIFAGVGAPGVAEAFCPSTTCVNDCQFDESGCKVTGIPLRWASGCVGFSFQKDGSENITKETARPALSASFGVWADMPCEGGPSSLTFVQLDDVSCRKAEYNVDEANANIVMWQDYKWKYQGIDNTLAKTTVTYDSDSGLILDADIEINHAYNLFTVGEEGAVNDVQSVVQHEVGHLMGLDHTPVIGATMATDYAEGSLRRLLSDDDVQAACAMYPPGRGASCDSTPLGGFSKDCGGEEVSTEEREEEGGCAIAQAPGLDGESDGGAPGWGWALATLLALGAVRQRRR